MRACTLRSFGLSTEHRVRVCVCPLASCVCVVLAIDSLLPSVKRTAATRSSAHCSVRRVPARCCSHLLQAEWYDRVLEVCQPAQHVTAHTDSHVSGRPLSRRHSSAAALCVRLSSSALRCLPLAPHLRCSALALSHVVLCCAVSDCPALVRGVSSVAGWQAVVHPQPRAGQGTHSAQRTATAATEGGQAAQGERRPAHSEPAGGNRAGQSAIRHPVSHSHSHTHTRSPLPLPLPLPHRVTQLADASSAEHVSAQPSTARERVRCQLTAPLCVFFSVPCRARSCFVLYCGTGRSPTVCS